MADIAFSVWTIGYVLHFHSGENMLLGYILMLAAGMIEKINLKYYKRDGKNLLCFNQLLGSIFLSERKPSLIELREYQRELAKIALKGENTIILAGTNAGKTYVAFHIIENHLLKNPDGKY
jgi:replicative superfamily II helicase